MNKLLECGRVWVLICLVSVLGAGCASSNTPGDPLEGFNRAMFGFNEALDDAVLKPLATGYKNITPEPARDCVGNVFSNINDVFVAINSLLQGKAGDAVSDACRVLINSTVGILGCFDVASKMGLEKHNRDFGQTFGKWGIASGPYLVLPFLGPSSIRDGVGRVIYSSLDPVWANHIPTRNVAFSLRTVDTRASLLTAGRAVEDAALDKYAFIRDAYVQRRQSMIEDDSNRARDRRSDAADQPSTSAVELAPPTSASLPPVELPANAWLDEANQRAGTRVKLAAKAVAVGGPSPTRNLATLAQAAAN